MFNLVAPDADAVAVAVVPTYDVIDAEHRSLSDADKLGGDANVQCGACRDDQRYHSMLLAHAAVFLFAILVSTVFPLFSWPYRNSCNIIGTLIVYITAY